MPAQIRFGGKHTKLCQRRGIKMIAVIGKVRHLAKPGTPIFSCCYLFHLFMT
jgi:hypothetical protein